MALNLKLSYLNAQPLAERQRLLGELVDSARAQRNGQAALIQQRIRDLERQYELTSEELRQRLRDGEISETAEISRWLFLLDSQENRTPGDA